MSFARVSDEGIQQLRDSISRLKSEIREREELYAERDSKLWKMLGPGIKASIDKNREAIEEILDAGISRKNPEKVWEPVNPMADFGALKSLNGAIKAWKHIIESVEIGEVIERKNEHLNSLIEELKRIETEQG